jgi:hypothetical protein
MKFTYIAAIAVAIAAPAMAQTSSDGIVLTNTPEMAMGFDNRDECQSTFRELRNDQRKSGARGGEPYNSMSNKDYNRESRETTRCEQLDDGLYYVVFNANGF